MEVEYGFDVAATEVGLVGDACLVVCVLGVRLVVPWRLGVGGVCVVEATVVGCLVGLSGVACGPSVA